MSKTKLNALLTTPKRAVRLWHPNRAVIIGCGGIGSHLWDFIAQEMWARSELNKTPNYQYSMQQVVKNFVLVDNDAVESKNLFRQSFFPEHVGMSKAEAMASKYSRALTAHDIKVESKKVWVDEKTDFFQSGDIILLCVDNHATRKMVNDCIHPSRGTVSLNNTILVNGGNTDTTVTVQVMAVTANKIATASLEHMHPDISNPDDKHPRDVSCMDREASVKDPQLFRANLMAATQMFQIFMNALERREIDYCELWMNVGDQSFRKVDIPVSEVLHAE